MRKFANFLDSLTFIKKVNVSMHNRFSADNLKFAFLSQLITFVVILQQCHFRTIVFCTIDTLIY